MLTQKRLKELLSYDPDTGHFAWRVQRRGTVRLDDPNGCPVGCLHGDGRLVITLDGRTYQANRLAWLYVHGVWPLRTLRFADGDPGNLAIANLRAPPPPSRVQPPPRPRTRATNATPFIHDDGGQPRVRGVTFDKTRDKWVARPTIAKKRRLLGYFDTEQAAQDAVLAAFARP